MQKERQEMAVSSNGNRVSPYPLRSCRNKKQKEAKSPTDLESVSEWEDVRCVICFEPPHNAVLLQCSSFSKGCRAYMCDTSGRHSNCFKQYRRSNITSRCNGKTLHCPYCRGEVYGTTKSTSARRFMNARPRCCSIDKCGFSGTYSQLKTHLKAAHPDITPPKLEHCDHQRIWQQLEREAEYMAMLNARQSWESEQRLLGSSFHQYHHPMIGLNFDTFMHNFILGDSMESRGRNQVSPAPAHMPQLEFHGTVYPRWTP